MLFKAIPDFCLLAGAFPENRATLPGNPGCKPGTTWDNRHVNNTGIRYRLQPNVILQPELFRKVSRSVAKAFWRRTCKKFNSATRPVLFDGATASRRTRKMLLARFTPSGGCKKVKKDLQAQARLAN